MASRSSRSSPATTKLQLPVRQSSRHWGPRGRKGDATVRCCSAASWRPCGPSTRSAPRCPQG
eukprot:7230426-Alexandrium_andersonii.AAC.1